MENLLKSLCMIDSTSGDEQNIRDFIIEQIKDYCEYKTDNLGNIIAFKKGKARAQRKIMADAHIDEVGLIITNVTADGFLKFKTVGGIETSSLTCRRVLINGKTVGVIGMKPIHLTSGDEGKLMPKADSLYIDIGAADKEEALEYVNLGDRAVICSEYTETEDKIKSKALDDRVGCANLIRLIKEYDEYDFYATFTVQEEIGLRGAKTATFSVEPDAAVILETTTAADIDGVPQEKTVCALGKGVCVSFMDMTTLYDKAYFDAATNSGLDVQIKSSVTGGNNSGAIHLSKSGVRTITLSVPCRYIHSASSVADESDIKAQFELAKYMISGIASGKIK